MMRTTILVTAVLVSMLSASTVYAQRVESALVDGHPVINCDRMQPSLYTTVAKGSTEAELSTAVANEKVYKRFAVSKSDNGDLVLWSNAFIFCSNLGSGWRLPTQRELMLMWVLKRELEKEGSGFTKFGARSYYWSASEYYSYSSWIMHFGNGSTYTTNRTTGFRVRCVRELMP